jgi:hypothetical protein
MPSNGSAYASATQLQYTRYTNSGDPNFQGTGVNNILFLDGNQINSNIQDNVVVCFHGLKNALHHNLQGSVIYSSPQMQLSSLAAALGGNAGASVASGISNSPYVQNFYVVAWDATCYDDESVLMGGSPATSANFQMSGYNSAQGANIVTLIVCYDVLVCWEADGSIVTRR